MSNLALPDDQYIFGSLTKERQNVFGNYFWAKGVYPFDTNYFFRSSADGTIRLNKDEGYLSIFVSVTYPVNTTNIAVGDRFRLRIYYQGTLYQVGFFSSFLQPGQENYLVITASTKIRLIKGRETFQLGMRRENDEYLPADGGVLINLRYTIDNTNNQLLPSIN